MNRANLFVETAAKPIRRNHLLLCFCFFTSLLWCPHRSLSQSRNSGCALLASLQGGFVLAHSDPSPADKEVFTMGGSPLEDSLARSRWVSKVGATGSPVVDTAVNGIKLNNWASTEKVLGAKIWAKHFEQDMMPRIEVVNRDKTQVLRLFFFYGGSRNSVDQFELLSIDKSYKLPAKAVVLDVAGFVTSRKIELGNTTFADS